MTFLWNELLTSDAPAAARFYADLLGWEVGERQWSRGGKPVAGVRQTKLHPHWAPFVRVPDAARCAAACEPAGGRVAARPFEGAVVLLDPWGVPTVAVDADWHVGDAFAWNMLESTDVPAAITYYERVFGWSLPGGRGIWDAGVQVGSHIAGEHDRWLAFATVADLAGTRARAAALGARVETAEVAIPSDRGRYAVLVDPQGAAFCAFTET